LAQDSHPEVNIVQIWPVLATKLTGIHGKGRRVWQF
jgi:hypothetical protein